MKKELMQLQMKMKENNIDYYVITTSDFHSSEYVADYFASRAFVSGFTGSAGTLVVGKNFAGLWTDSRYFIQGKTELEGSGIELKKQIDKDSTCTEFLKQNLKSGETLGFDARTMSADEGIEIEKFANSIGAKVFDIDLVSSIWEDRPNMPSGEIYPLTDDITGETIDSKINYLRDEIKKSGANFHIISALDEIAYLLNLRGSDVTYNTVFLSYFTISENDAILYVNESKLNFEARDILKKNSISIKPYDAIYSDLKNLNSTHSVLIDTKFLNYSLYANINPESKKIVKDNPLKIKKSIKNDTELNKMKHYHKLDGVAMVKFIKWLKESISRETITEICASDKLEEFRRQNEGFVDLSFSTIAGFADHGAIVHYHATNQSQHTLKEGNILLLDSGAQYMGATTDITRTLAIGEITNEQIKSDFTLVLKAHLGLARAKFPSYVTGTNLDSLAKIHLWEEACDYGHGTGHGIGAFLSVHEGPQRIASTYNSVSLRPGMIISNEPGLYREGSHGIRIENLVFVKWWKNTEFGEFYEFENLTLTPIDLNLINKNLLDEREIKQLNEYHKRVYNELSPLLDEEHSEFLKQITREI